MCVYIQLELTCNATKRQRAITPRRVIRSRLLRFSNQRERERERERERWYIEYERRSADERILRETHIGRYNPLIDVIGGRSIAEQVGRYLALDESIRVLHEHVELVAHLDARLCRQVLHVELVDGERQLLVGRRRRLLLLLLLLLLVAVAGAARRRVFEFRQSYALLKN